MTETKHTPEAIEAVITRQRDGYNGDYGVAEAYVRCHRDALALAAELERLQGEIERLRKLCAHKQVIERSGLCADCDAVVWERTCPKHPGVYKPNEMRHCGWCFVAEVYG